MTKYISYFKVASVTLTKRLVAILTTKNHLQSVGYHYVIITLGQPVRDESFHSSLCDYTNAKQPLTLA